MSNAYTISLGMDKMTIVVNFLMQTIQSEHEETNTRLFALQLLMLMAGFELGDVTTP